MAGAVVEYKPLEVRIAHAEDREAIFKLRHEVYAAELSQHPQNPEGRLQDPLDRFNTYIVAADGSQLAGFVSITPPGAPSWSVDKYFDRKDLPVVFDDRLYEVRLLTVAHAWRGGPAAALLMHATLRWVEARGGREIVIIGRREVAELYRAVGFEPLGPTCRSGAVTYELMAARVDDLLARGRGREVALRRLERRTHWRLGVPFLPGEGPGAEPCDHGGAFFRAVGEEFDDLSRRAAVVNADVLDAWFPPAPSVVDTLREHLPWALGTSPPTGCEGLIRVIARERGVPAPCIVPGAGSSDLIFRAFNLWLTPRSRACVLDPTYGEYAHVLERVVGCRADRLWLRREEGFKLDPARVIAAAAGCDLLVLVNPNNPTGVHVPRIELEAALARIPARTRVWVDEAYVEYAGADQSLERFAASSPNVVVCKSLSKAYALSGARAAYLVAPERIARELRRITPPWAIGLPAQIAAVRALEDPGYYAERYRETAALRQGLVELLRRNRLSIEIHAGAINCVLCRLPDDGPDAAAVVARCRGRGVFIRDCASISPSLAGRWVRIAVKDAATNERVVGALAAALGPS